ncbi:MAG: hypothetical protein EOP24_37330 [Hyphomicrobiales bacterium]|nr:MAG: hypothetical protein EOP24_37330 [Hyphomicrobiales bacterium]
MNIHFPGEGGIRSVIEALRALYKRRAVASKLAATSMPLLVIKEVNDEILTVYEQAEHDRDARSGTAVNDE